MNLWHALKAATAIAVVGWMVSPRPSATSLIDNIAECQSMMLQTMFPEPSLIADLTDADKEWLRANGWNGKLPDDLPPVL